MPRTRVARRKKPRKSKAKPTTKEEKMSEFHERKLDVLEKTAVTRWQKVAVRRAREIRNKLENGERLSNGKYDPLVHPVMVVKAMAEGSSCEELALEIGVLPSTLKKWYKEHEEFREAVEEGIDLAKAWWYQQGRINIHNSNFNASLYKANMTNRFGWGTKRIESNPSTVINNQYNIEAEKVDVKSLSTEALELLESELEEQDLIEPSKELTTIPASFDEEAFDDDDEEWEDDE